VCGIEPQQGKNYKDLKSAILGLKNKGFWLTKADGTEVTVSWIDKAEISPNSGKISILLDKDMFPLLLELHEKFTKYQLIYTLAMRSKYAVRLYELLKSYENRAAGSTTVEFDLDWFKNRVGAEYELWYDVQRKVISVAVNEINLVSDILVTYKGVKKGRSFVAIKFFIESKKDFSSQTATERAIYNRLTGKKGKRERSQMAGQLSLDGGEVDE
jgi:plasmid replication initiation protein